MIYGEGSGAGPEEGRDSAVGVLDVLVAGGGPAGTAVAFRARELGMSVLVVEYDDLMKRIRDYSKDKLILPSFGGGDRMKFPQGDAMIESLRFAPIDKDEMCVCWKDLYRQHAVPTRLGFELTGLSRRPSDGAYEVKGWDHAARVDATLLARSVVIAIGRGVPRRFDVPGNTQGIAFRMEDPQQFVGQPACVVGGGTSAAEAVIAISGAKAAAGDPTAIYWSYRGDKMPRVSKALAEVFFAAYMGNGNIRYFPRSEPAAVVTGEDRSEYLAIRTDRRLMTGRPTETSHLEFPKESCMACIGEDIPTALLSSIGIEMVTGGPRSRKRLPVNRYLETCQPHVYLAGDLLSPGHFEVDDFDADPATFREVKHRGNIKAALRDGVLVAEVVRQRLDGKAEIHLDIGEAEDLEPAPSPLVSTFVPVPTAAPADESLPEESFAAGRKPVGQAGYLLRLLPGGVVGEEYPLAAQTVSSIGRGGCDITFPDDTLLAEHHASLVLSDDGCLLRDDGSPSGVFLRLPIHRKIALEPGDLLCAGRQFLLLGSGDDGLFLVHYDQAGKEIRRIDLPDRSIILGRKSPDVTLEAGDRTLSRRQLAISAVGGIAMAKDLKSVNGTFLKVRGAVQLEHGDRFRVGQQLFVYSAREDAVFDDESPASTSAILPIVADGEPGTLEDMAPIGGAPIGGAQVSQAAAAADGSPSVTFAGLGQTCAALPGQTICDVAEANGIALNAECHAGICGSDPIRVLAGLENLTAGPDHEETDTLADLCDLEAGECRLACKTMIKGPVTVEILQPG